MVGCGDDSTTGPEPDVTPPPSPTNLIVTQQSQGFALDWDIPLIDGEQVPDLRGYRVYRDPAFSTAAKQGAEGEVNERAPQQEDYIFVLESQYLDRSVEQGSSYGYSVTAVDDSLNESDAVESDYYIYDTGSPVVSITSPASGYVTNVSTVTVAGTVVDSQEVGSANIYVDNVVVAQATVVAGAFSSQVTLNYGDNELKADATDPSGNIGVSSVVTVILDTSAVVVQITSPSDGTLTSQDRVEVSGVVSDPAITQGTLIVNGDERSIVIQNGGFDGIFADLDEGMNSLEVRATNQAGSTGSSGIVRVTRDSQQPAVYLLEPVDGATVQESPIYVSGTVTDANPPDSVSLSVSGDSRTLALVQGQFQAYADLQEGSNSIIVTVVDLAGNAGTASASVVLNSEGPIVRITTPQEGALLNDPVVNVGGTVSDTNIQTGNLFVDGIPQSISIESGIFLEAVSLTTDGEHRFWVEATDAYNRTGVSDTVGITLDTTGPILTISTPADSSMGNNTSVSVAGTIDDEEVETVTVVVNGFGVEATVQAGTFSAQVSLIEGWNSIYAEGTDVAQNTGQSEPISVLLDTQAEIFEIDHDAGGLVLEIGDHVLFWLDAQETGGQATVDIADIHTGITLYDNGTNGDPNAGDGIYYRDYTVQATDEAVDAQVIGHFTDHVGNVALDEVAQNGITINTPPSPVTLVQPTWTEVTSSAANLKWTASTAADFHDYRLFRSGFPGVDTLSTLVTTITDIGQDTVYYSDQDPSLDGGSTYYYRVYVRDALGASAASNEVSARIDDWPSHFTMNIPVGHLPTYMAKLDVSSGTYVILSHLVDTGDIRFINLATDEVEAAVGPETGVEGWTVGVCSDPWGEALIAGYQAHKIYRLHHSDLTYAWSIELERSPWGVASAFGPQDSLYAFAGGGDSVAVINLNNERVSYIPTGGISYADFGTSPDRSTVYAAGEGSRVAVINPLELSITEIHSYSRFIQRMDIFEDYIFLAHNQDDRVSVVNRYTMQRERELTVSGEPVYSLLLPGEQYLYISCRQAGVVSVWDTATWAEIDRIAVPVPLALIADETGDKVYVGIFDYNGAVRVLER
jgi:hypothetical protein